MLSAKRASIGVALLLAATMIAAQTGETPPTIESAKTVTAPEAKSLIDKGGIVLDVRAAKSFEEGHLPKAKSIRAAYNDKTTEFDPASFGTNKDAPRARLSREATKMSCWTTADAGATVLACAFS